LQQVVVALPITP